MGMGNTLIISEHQLRRGYTNCDHLTVWLCCPYTVVRRLDDGNYLVKDPNADA